MDNELRWDITAVERRGQIQKAVVIIGPILLLIVISTVADTLAKNHDFSFKKIIAVAFGVIVCFLILLIVNRFFPYKQRSYILNNEGLTISKGKKIRRYLWSDFDCFYQYYAGGYGNYQSQYRYDVTGDRRRILEAEKSIEGSIFYLKKIPKNIFAKLYKTFVVVYSEIANSNAVSDFLNSHLTQQTMSAKTELGLIFYEFK